VAGTAEPSTCVCLIEVTFTLVIGVSIAVFVSLELLNGFLFELD